MYDDLLPSGQRCRNESTMNTSNEWHVLCRSCEECKGQ
jgi:hypothetical protein